MHHRLAAALVLALAAACGGSSKPAPAAPADEHADHHEGDHPAMPPALDAFHAKLSPLWHAEAGPQRQSDTCSESEVMAGQLDEVALAPVPEGVDAATWQARVGELQTRWTALVEDCAQVDGENFAETFPAAHDAFHALIALLPMADH